MSEAMIRDRIQKHANAAVRGDMDAYTADFSAEFRPQVPQLAQALPQPVTSAEVRSVDIGDPVSVAMIRYSGSRGDVTIRSDWQDEGGRSVIVRAVPHGVRPGGVQPPYRALRKPLTMTSGDIL